MIGIGVEGKVDIFRLWKLGQVQKLIRKRSGDSEGVCVYPQKVVR